MAYQQFIGYRLLPSEMVDVYLADLWKLSVPHGGMNAGVCLCNRIVSQILHVTSRMDKLSTDQLLVVVAARPTQSEHVLQTLGPSARIKCYRCNCLKHLVRECLQKGARNSGTFLPLPYVPKARDPVTSLSGKQVMGALCQCHSLFPENHERDVLCNRHTCQ